MIRAKFHSKSLYSVEKRLWESRSTPTLVVIKLVTKKYLRTNDIIGINL
jgi:hypothetical protein